MFGFLLPEVLRPNGLRNGDNRCFANAILQCVSASPLGSAVLQQLNFLPKGKSTKEHQVQKALELILKELRLLISILASLSSNSS
jgi:ubiquitin C-terminal hydrolase